MKKALIIISIIIVLIVVGVFMLLSNLNSLVAKAIEKNGTEATQTRVTVSGVELKLRDGRGSIKGLKVASPDGFKASDAFSLQDITVGIDVESLRSEPIVITEILIQAPVVNAEILKNGESNIEELRKRVQAFSGNSSSGPVDDSGQAAGQAKRIRIDQFIFEKGSINIDASELGLEKRTIDLPEIRLSNIGGAEGATPDEITKIILGAVAEKVSAEIAGSELRGLIEDKLGGSIKEKSKELLDKIGG
ncbi:MAG: AsmA family protein [Bacteroidales bacterium]|nr:AsmA family protein [Candidatus Latescibacterota bacterium]